MNKDAAERSQHTGKDAGKTRPMACIYLSVYMFALLFASWLSLFLEKRIRMDIAV